MARVISYEVTLTVPEQAQGASKHFELSNSSSWHILHREIPEIDFKSSINITTSPIFGKPTALAPSVSLLRFFKSLFCVTVFVSASWDGGWTLFIEVLHGIPKSPPSLPQFYFEGLLTFFFLILINIFHPRS